MNNFKVTLRFLMVILALNFWSCTRDIPEDNTSKSSTTASYEGDLANEWYQLLLEIDRYSPGYRPPAASRAFGYIGLAAYESVVPGMPENNSMESSFPGLSIPKITNNAEYHWGLSVNAAYATIIKSFYPHIKDEHIAKINTLEKKHHDIFVANVTELVVNNSESFGRNVAIAVYKYSETDTYGHEGYKDPKPSSYIPPTTGTNGEKLWQPTWPDYSPALFPYWGKVRPFALKEQDKLAKPPIEWSEDPNSKFYNQAKEIKIWIDNSTDEDKWISEFWSDDYFEFTMEPAGRMLSLTNQMSKSHHLNLADATELYAKLGMAICDAAISVWNSKYVYNVERPISYIRRTMDPNWKTILNNPFNDQKGTTPEFPSYPSGHSGFAGAATGVLSDFFGNNNKFTDYSHYDRTEFMGQPRHYIQILDIGVENAYSRLPLGVHYRMDCDEGIRLGYLAAKRVLALPWKK